MGGIDEFDADFFGFTPQAARMMDPQHRLFLQCAWHGLKTPATTRRTSTVPVGVYATSTTSGYLLHNLMSHYDPNEIDGQACIRDGQPVVERQRLSGDAVAHQFNLRGPALSVQTACSSCFGRSSFGLPEHFER